jgi:hypothetical protein
MATEAGMCDWNHQYMEKPISRTTRSSLLVLATIALFSALFVFQSSDMLDSVQKTETKRLSVSVNQTVSINQTISMNQSASTRETFQRVQLTREEQRGSWIGNSWIPPPGWRIYSASELRNFYRDKSILWIGDSMARRAATLLYGILNTTESSHVSIGAIDGKSISDPDENSCRGWRNPNAKSLCRVMPGGSRWGGKFLLRGAVCLGEVEKLLSKEVSGQSRATADVDIIIVSLGIWEAARSNTCNGNSRYNPKKISMLQMQSETISLLEKLQSPRRSIVWRTSGYTDTGKREDIINEMNGKAMDQMDKFASGEASRSPKRTSNLTYVDWGGAIHPRSIGKARIKGDHYAHYGLTARFVLIQMITNQLASQMPGLQLQTS